MGSRWVLRSTLLRAAGTTGTSSLSSGLQLSLPGAVSQPTDSDSAHDERRDDGQQRRMFHGSGCDDDFFQQRAQYRAWRQGSARSSPRSPTARIAEGRPDRAQRSLLLQEIQPQPSPRIVADYEKFSLLGRGAFGVVYRARNRHDGTSYALKVVPSRGAATEEARCMASLPPHPHLVRYHTTWREPLPIERVRNRIEDERCADRCATLHPHHGYGSDADEAPSTEPSSVLQEGSSSSISEHMRADGPVPTLCMQLEAIAMPTLQAVLRHEMASRARASGHAGATDAPTVGVVPAATKWRWLAAVASGLEAVHAAGWLHNDVKPAKCAGYELTRARALCLDRAPPLLLY